MVDKKLLELNEITQTSGSNFIYILDDPTNAKVDNRIQVDNLIYSRRWHPDRPPLSPTIYDDEFELPSLASKWTVITDTANTKYFGSMYPSWLMFKYTDNQGWEVKQSYAPAGDFSITAKATMPAFTNYAGIRITALDAAESQGVMAVYEYGGGTRLQLATKDTGTWNYNRTQASMGAIGLNTWYVHLQRTGSNWFVAISPDGYSFYRQANYSKSVTVDHVQVSVSQAGQTTPVLAGIDWFRVNWVTLP